MTTLSQRRSGARNGARLAEAAVRDELARQQQARDEEHAAGVARRKVAREAERTRRKFSADDLRQASHVRDSLGWHRVVRVSAKSVTVATAYSWTDRVDLSKVLDFAVDGKSVTE